LAFTTERNPDDSNLIYQIVFEPELSGCIPYDNRIKSHPKPMQITRPRLIHFYSGKPKETIEAARRSP